MVQNAVFIRIDDYDVPTIYKEVPDRKTMIRLAEAANTEAAVYSYIWFALETDVPISECALLLAYASGDFLWVVQDLFGVPVEIIEAGHGFLKNEEDACSAAYAD